MIKKTIALMVAAVATASLLTACNMPAACEDDALTSSAVTGSKPGPKVRLSKPKPGSKYKPHGSTSHRHHPSGHHDFDDDCD